ncbi:MAG: hypothetical protein IKE23_10995, partial [Exiguobacterium sp.]|nr:hypothetical protein [Exiguobacterium sp.]
MPVTIGEVTTFPHPRRDQEQMNKILEEVNELFVEWRKVDKCGCDASYHCDNVNRLIEEAADTIEAICNLLAALGVDDMRGARRACAERTRARG